MLLADGHARVIKDLMATASAATFPPPGSPAAVLALKYVDDRFNTGHVPT